MTRAYATDLWIRAKNACRSAEVLVAVSPDDAVSRAYYAAFDAVSAFFAIKGRCFKKHTELRAAVHRDLIATREWSSDLGDSFDTLWELRDLGDYGGAEHVEKSDAESALAAVRKIMAAIAGTSPEFSTDEPLVHR